MMNAHLFAKGIASLLCGLSLGACSVSAQSPVEPPQVSAFVAFEPAQLDAITLSEFDAPEADQGAAVDAQHFYAVDNFVIGKFDKASGVLVERWIGQDGGLIAHLNSCLELVGELWCANSNYPETPMASSIEVFTTTPLAHAKSHSLGILDEGSLTWFDQMGDDWIAGFAHYAEKGGLAYKDPSFAGIVLYDNDWRRKGGWQFPQTVLDRMAPYAASGGAVGPDEYLYIMGHDRPEMYVLAKPSMGPKLIHIATIAIEAEGQAFSWDHAAYEETGARQVYVVDRRNGKVRQIGIPQINRVPSYALRFGE